MKAIPKVIHIIWLGGDIPQRNRDCIVTFPRLNPDWQVNLWIDANQLLTGERSRQIRAQHNGAVSQQQWSAVADRLGAKGGDATTIAYLRDYLHQRGETLQDMRAARVNSIINFCELNRIRLREVQRDLKMGKNAPIYLRELVNRGANFGSASDILRIEILLQYGGIYVDTDVNCVRPLGAIICHQSYPRFSAVDPAWKQGISETDWSSPDWWKVNIKGQQVPFISNSIIAGHAGSNGLKTYRRLISDNFKALATDARMELKYLNAIRSSTIEMTGPSAAARSSGFKTLQDKMFMEQGDPDDPDRKLKNLLQMRDHWYFPMYKIRDNYFHDWL